MNYKICLVCDFFYPNMGGVESHLYHTVDEIGEENLEVLSLLEIELEGARQVRRSFPSGFQIFLAPPSFSELERRIRGRGTDSEEAILRRLTRAEQELKAQDEFDAVVINDTLDTALAELERLMKLC